MRLIIQDSREQFLTPFCRYLDSQDIDHEFEQNKGMWGIWIIDEDQIEKTKALYEEYKAHPKDSKYQIKAKISPLKAIPKHSNKKSKRIVFKSNFTSPSGAQKFGRVTLVIILLCILFTFFGRISLPSEKHVAVPPTLQSKLMYDTDLSWPGYYYLYLSSITYNNLNHLLELPPSFEAYENHDWWRLFTPCLLHSNILHLFFNMLWLVLLGNQVERHLGRSKYIFMILLIGIFSNTCQYFVSGASFVGFSGVISGLFTFIWFRQKFAAWEGYMLAPATALFLTIFLLGMAALEALSFASIVLNSYGYIPFSIPSNGIANTAHLSGALVGIILAKWNFFRQKNT